MGLAHAPARLVLDLARLAHLVRLARRHLARRHLVRRLVSANSSNVNMQHIRRDQPTATRMHVRATRASRAFAVRVHARCACSGPTDKSASDTSILAFDVQARVAM